MLSSLILNHANLNFGAFRHPFQQAIRLMGVFGNLVLEERVLCRFVNCEMLIALSWARPGILQTIEHAPHGVRAHREADNPGFSNQTTLVFRHLNSSKKWNWIKTIENKNLYGENITSRNCLSDNVGFGWCSNLLLDKTACKLCARSWQVSLQQLTEIRNGGEDEMRELYLRCL